MLFRTSSQIPVACRVLPVICSLGVLITLASPPAGAQYFRRAAPYALELPPPEKRGCYYYRNREYCGSYCYWEVNGKRYCQRRERDAHSQVPLPEEFIIDGGMGLK